MKHLLLIGAALAVVTTPAFGAPCRGPTGKFIACAKAAPAKKAPCKDAKGKFTKCPA